MMFHKRRFVARALAFAGACIISQTASGGTVLYVDDDARPGGNGVSWISAFSDLEQAIAAAVAAPGEIHEIWVAAGVYRPSATTSTDPRSAQFRLPAQVTFFGHFVGTETSPDERHLSDPALASILSGDLNGDDQPGFQNINDNVFHVVVSQTINNAGALDGFTISGGNANGAGNDANGAGVLVLSGAPRIRNSEIRENVAMTFGGGLYSTGAAPTVGSTLFDGNQARFGGAAAINNGSTPLLVNCTFVNNHAELAGGGTYTRVDSTTDLSNCVLWFNSDSTVSLVGAQEISAGGGETLLEDCCIQGWTTGGTTIGDNPAFVDSAHGNFRLMPASACIDSGSTAAVPADLKVDLDGHPRLVDDHPCSPLFGESQYPATVDRGAYELVHPTTLYSPRLYVNPRVGSPGDGSSWNNALNDLNMALCAAGNSSAIEEIWVVSGTYLPTYTHDSRDPRAKSFKPRAGLRIIGHFLGTESSIDERLLDDSRGETILSGDRAGDDGPEFAGNGENVYHVVRVQADDNSLLLDGFTITGGNASAGGPDELNGAGVYFYGSGDLTLANCRFTGNWADAFGGGVYMRVTPESQSELHVSDCLFEGNVSAYGGGMHSFQALVQMARTRFENNISSTSGGGYNSDGGSLDADACEFVGNQTGSTGGAVTATNGRIANSVLQFNSADVTGGAIRQSGGLLTIESCRLESNDGHDGGAIFSEGSLTLANSLLALNQAFEGGAVLKQNQPLVVRNCTITQNDAVFSVGGIWHNSTSPVEVWNSILWDNDDAGPPDQSAEIGGYGRGPVTVNSSCVQGWTGSLAGTGVIDDDPLFLDPESGVFQLQKGSPCIDAADNLAAPPGIQLDLDGNQRFVDDPSTVDTGIGRAPIVDMGAFEFQVSDGPAADLNGDGLVNSLDLGILLSAWSIPPGAPGCGGTAPCPADLNHDGFVNSLDLGILLSYWTL